METKQHIISLEGPPELELHREITIPIDCRASVLFAHGSGSGRHSPRNRYTVSSLQASGSRSQVLIAWKNP